MALQLNAKESIARGLKRAAAADLKSAAKTLQESRGDRDEAIHTGRKAVKKTRAILRLVRFELGPLYTTQNTVLRDLGRKLSDIRDAGALLGTLDQLEDKYPKELRNRKLDGFRRALEKRKRDVENGSGLRRMLKDVAQAMEAEATAIENWPLQADDFGVLSRGLGHTYASGRKALKQASKEPTPENLHQLRKRVKRTTGITFDCLKASGRR